MTSDNAALAGACGPMIWWVSRKSREMGPPPSDNDPEPEEAAPVATGKKEATSYGSVLISAGALRVRDCAGGTHGGNVFSRGCAALGEGLHQLGGDQQGCPHVWYLQLLLVRIEGTKLC